MERIVLDASVWVSSAGSPGSVPDRAIDLARLGSGSSMTSEAIIDQVRRALLGPRFAWLPPAAAEAVDADMRSLSIIVAPDFKLTVVTAKESDNRILECAIAGGADLIVTGDRKHLLPLGSVRGIPILSPADFLRSR